MGRFADAEIGDAVGCGLDAFERLIEVPDAGSVPLDHGRGGGPAGRYDTPLFRRLQNFHRR